MYSCCHVRDIGFMLGRKAHESVLNTEQAVMKTLLPSLAVSPGQREHSQVQVAKQSISILRQVGPPVEFQTEISLSHRSNVYEAAVMPLSLYIWFLSSMLRHARLHTCS